MKKKHRMEKFLSSVIGTHVDTGNSETLPNKEDVEKDVERILQILRSENGHVSSEDSFDRSELASRLEYFQKGYQDIHGRYNHLLGKITKKFRPKGNDNGSFSIDFSSSDSESSESEPELSHKKSSRVQENKEDQVPIEDYYTLQRKLESANIKITELETMATAMNTKVEEGQTLTAKLAEREAWIIALKDELQTMSDTVEPLQAERDVLKIEVAALLGKGDGMNQRITILQEENETLRSENAEAFSRIHEMEKSIEKSEVELDQIKSDIQRVNSENMVLKEEQEITSKEVANLTQQLTTSIEEKTALRSGNFTFLSRIQEAEKALADFRNEAEQNLKLVTEELTSRNASLSSENENLKFRLEASDQRNSDMIQRVSAAEGELSSLKSDILRSSCQIEEAEKTIKVMKTDIGNREVENLKLLNVNNDLNQQLGVLKVENGALASDHLNAVEAMHRGEEEISALSNEIEKVKDENSELLAQYYNMELELAETNNKFSELKQLLEATQDEKQSLVTEISVLTNKIYQAEKTIDDFKAETNQLGIEKSEMQIKINDLSLELHAANLQSTNLKIAVEAAEEEKKILTSQSSEVLSNFQLVENNMKQLQEELGILRENNSMMQQKQIKLQEAENVIDDLKAEVEHLRDDNSQLKTDVSNLNLELEASKLQITDLSAKIEQMRVENSTLEQYRNDLQSQKHDLEVRLNEKLSEILSLQAELGTVKEEATNQIKSFTAQVNDLQRESGLLNNQKNELEEHIRVLTCRMEEDEMMIKNLQEELGTLRENNSMMQQKQIKLQEAENVIDLKAEIEHLRADNSQLKTEVSNLDLELEASKLQLTDLTAKIEQMREENSTLEQYHNDLQSQKLDLEATLNEKLSEILSLQAELGMVREEATSQIKSFTAQLQDLQRERGLLNNQKNELEEHIRLLTCRSEEDEEMIKNLQEELGTLRENNSMMQQKQIKLQEAENVIDDLKAEIEHLRDDKSQLKTDVSNLDLQLEASKLQLTDLTAKIEQMREENSTLEQYQNDQQSQKHDLEVRLNEKLSEILSLQAELGMVQEEATNQIKSFTAQVHDLQRESGLLNNQKKEVEEHIRVLTCRSEEDEMMIKNLQEELGTLRENNSMMQQKQIKLQEAENVIDDLKAEIEHLRADNSHLKTDVSDLDLELEASKLQLTDLSAKIEQMQEENSTLGQYHNDLQSQKLDLEVMLNEKLSEILSLQAELGTVQEEATNQIKSFTAQVHDLQRERDLLDNQKNELEEHIRLLTCRTIEDEEMIKNLQEELNSRIRSEEHTLKSQKDSFDELLGNYKKLETCLQESCEKLQFAERKSEELASKEETIQTLKAANEKQRKEMVKLEDIRKELLEKLELVEAEKADADRETAKLHKQVQNLEVQIRLSNQKLKITETENKEKEEGYKTTMQALREEHGELEGKFVTLSGKYDVLDKELRQLKTLADVEISALANGYWKLESVFKEKSAHIPMQLFECGKELKELKNWFAMLKNEKLELSARLENKAGIISMMKDEAESIKDKLAKAENELAILRTKEEESEKRIKVLEKMLREKKEEVSDKDEAKREAIRQLCLLIEYHRENCVHLSRYITSVLKRSRRTS